MYTDLDLRKKAIDLLGNNVGPEQAALAIGVSVSRISQLLAEDDVVAAVTERRLANVQGGIDRDKSYDSMEDILIKKLKGSIPLLVRPMEIVRALESVNKANRTTSGPVAGTTINQQVVNLTLPAKITANFVINNTRQVVEVGGKTMVPMQSSNLGNLVEKAKELVAPIAEAATPRNPNDIRAEDL